jgi:tryptophan synthase alpha chain
VTGVRDQVAANVPEAVALIRGSTNLPVAVGFGISTKAQVAQVAAVADGVVVGSVLVNCIRDNLGSPAKITARLGSVAADLTAGTQR